MKRSLIGVATAAALIASLLTGASASAAPPAAEYPADGAGSAARLQATLPILEPALGIGAPLTSGVPSKIAVRGTEADTHSALVRVTSTRVSQDTTVRIAGFSALILAKGQSGSATVLAPVIDGSIDVVADADVTVRIERIAAFSAEQTAPGSVHALAEPVVRADTANGLGRPDGGLVAGASTQIGLLAVGGMPDAGVRSAFITLVTSTPSGATVELAGTRLTVPAGTSTITTTVNPDELGVAELKIVDGQLADVTAAVLGFVVEPTDNPTALQGEGAFAPVAGAKAVTVSATTEKPVELGLKSPATADAVLALVTDADAASLSVLDMGEQPGGRAEGVVVDGARGAAPQLVLLSPESAAIAHGSDVDARVLPLGHIVGAAKPEDTSPQISVTSPTDGTVDTAETWTVDFAGTWSTPGDFAQRIEVALDGAPYGSAHLGRNGEWAFTASLPKSGTYDFQFTLVARGGNSTTDSWQGKVLAPDASDVVVTEDTVVLDDSFRIAAMDDSSVTFDADPGLVPGNVIVGGVTPATPNGLIARVISSDMVEGQWVVQTEPATLTDVFLQADVDEVLPVGAAPGAVVEGEQSMIVDGDPVEDGSVTASWDAVPSADLEPVEHPLDSADDSRISQDGAAVLKKSKAAPKSKPGVAPFATFEPASITQVIKADFSYADKVKVNAKAQLKLALKVTIDIEVRWTEASWWPPKPSLPYPHLNELKTVLESSAAADATATASVTKKYSWGAEKRFTREFAPITFSVGPVPVVITSVLDIKLEASLAAEGTAELTVTTSYSRTQELGFAYKNGTSQLVDPEPKTKLSAPKFTDGSGLSASMSAQAGPTLTFTAKLWDLAGPQLAVSLKAQIEASGSATVSDPFFKAEAELAIVGGFAAKVLVTVPVIDLEIVNHTLLDKQKKWVLWSGAFDLGNLVNPGPPAPGEGEHETDHGGGQLTPADDVIDAIEIVGADATAAYFVEGPPDPSAFAILNQKIGGFPTQGDDYIAMSTGSLARLTGSGPTEFSEVASSRSGAIFDSTTLRIDLTIPEGTNCLVGLDFRFYSDEYPHYVGSRFNDAFVAEFGKTTWELDGTDVYAPRNFAFDRLGNPITINAAGPFTINAENAEGHYGGATELLRATTPVLSGKTSLFLSIFDQGDSAYDSTVLVDRIEFGSVANPGAQCSAGVTQD